MDSLPPKLRGTFVNADVIETRLAVGVDLAEYEICPPNGETKGRLDKFILASGQAAQGGVTCESFLVTGCVVRAAHAEQIGYSAAVLADFVRSELLEAGLSFSFETVLSHKDKISFMREAQVRGYRTYLYFVSTDDPDINVARVQSRVEQGGHAVDERKIRSRYRRSLENLWEACEASNRAYVFDNSGDQHVLIVELDEDQVTVHVDELPAWIERTGLADFLREAGASQ